MYASVLVALDGSPLAAEAVPHGLALARRLGARLILLRVVPAIDDLETETAAPDPLRAETSADVLRRRQHDVVRSQAEGYLYGLAKSLTGAGATVEVRVLEGRASAVIVDSARRSVDPLIVITPYGRTASLTPERRGVFGGVADEVLRTAASPVLVVKAAVD